MTKQSVTHQQALAFEQVRDRGPQQGSNVPSRRELPRESSVPRNACPSLPGSSAVKFAVFKRSLPFTDFMNIITFQDSCYCFCY